ncbi:ribonuclease P protein subunit p25-like protein isoform X2 [Nylanderia fulva]|uniref:ribonuclease P protein subunit p25-like protein isoform X2 n=1 Tax=Nylanderia fulva TaxID=613905 RepID=UPI0010FAEBA9|nr:ribonuclease P protein subunit p25-like protein isoform X2 [Nylanderia fulva]
MGKSKLIKRLKREEESAEESTNTKVPIDNLPKKFLWMHVKNGTKIRNVLDYALKEFPNYNSIVWTGIGQGIVKTISCAELFKRNQEGLHQVTKLCYTESEKEITEKTINTHRVPEIHILLTKDIKDITELGYQAPDDCGEFSEKEAVESKPTKNVDNIPCNEQFIRKKLNIGQKRNNKWINNAKFSSKKSKKSTS